jgi:tetrahydromethanopterin S-methyltransferase subunit G
MSNIQIESDLKEILNKLDQKLDQIDNKFEQKLDQIDNKFEHKLDQIDNKFGQKLDNLQKDVTDINLRLTKVETKLDGAVEDIKEMKGSQNAQIWALIGVLITAVGGFLVAVGRSVFSLNP